MAEPPATRTVSPSAAPLDVPVAPRNPGMPLELDWVEEVRVNRSAVERRAATLRDPAHGQEGMAGRLAAPRRHPDGPHHAFGRRHARPRPPALRQGAPAGPRGPAGGDGREQLPIRVGAVCVYHPSWRPRVEALEGSGIPVAAVSTGFPAGLSPFAQRLAEIRASVAAGAEEIDIVITRGPRAHRELARALRRGARHARGLRRRPHQDHPGHRRAGHAAERGARQPGVHDGRAPTSSRPRPARRASTPRCRSAW